MSENQCYALTVFSPPAGETVEAWAHRLMHDNQTGWLSPGRDAEEPICSVMQGQCTRSYNLEEDNCDACASPHTHTHTHTHTQSTCSLATHCLIQL